MPTDLVVLSASDDPYESTRLANMLEGLGLTTWVAARDMGPSGGFEEQYLPALHAAKGVAILIDSDELAFGASQGLRYASSLRAPVLAIRDKGTATIPGAVQTLDWDGLTFELVGAALQSQPTAATADGSGAPPKLTDGSGSSGVDYGPADAAHLDPARLSAAEQIRSYSDSDGIGKWAVAFLGAATALDVMLSWFAYQVVGGFSSASPKLALFSVLQHQFFAYVSIGAMLLAAVPFLMWYYRAYQNLTPTGNRDLKYTAKMAVGSFFIPFANLFLPAVTMQTLWKGTSSTNVADPFGWKKARGSFLVVCWAVCWLLPQFVERIIAQSSFHSSDSSTSTATDQVENVKTIYMWLMSSDMLEAISGVVLVVLILRIIQRQRARYERFSLEVAGITPVSRTVGSSVGPAMACGVLVLGVVGLSLFRKSNLDEITASEFQAITDGQKTGGSGSPDTPVNGLNPDQPGTQPAADGWHAYSPPDQTFSVELPATPVEPPGQSTAGVHQIMGANLTENLSVTVVDLSSDVASAAATNPNDLLDRELTAFATSIGTAAGEPRSTTVGDLSGRQLDCTMKHDQDIPASWTSGTMVDTVKGNHVYLLMAMGEPGDKFNSDVSRFLASFKVP